MIRRWFVITSCIHRTCALFPRAPYSISRFNYCRRTFTDKMKLSSYDAVGFDIDHTLALYNIPVLYEEVYNVASKFLIEKKGYPVELFQPFETYKEFCTRGLILDMKLGNVLKISSDGYICRAYHGTSELSRADIQQAYGQACDWSCMERFLDEVNNINPDLTEGEESFRIFENFYDIPGVILGARLIDHIDEKAGGKADSYTIVWRDLMIAFNTTFHPKNFAVSKEGWFADIRENPLKYILPCSNAVKDLLTRLKTENKFLFLVTSSHADFASHTMNTILGENWRSYFDVVIANAKKPTFFKQNERPFKTLDGVVESEDAAEIERHGMYAQGNADGLNKLIATHTKDNPKILFFGDSMRADMCPSHVHTQWDRCMILEEMRLEQHDQEYEQANKKLKTTEHAERIVCHTFHTSTIWGSFFHDPCQRDVSSTGDAPTRAHMNTLWGRLLARHANVVIPKLDVLADVGLDEDISMFTSEADTSGFYPHKPHALVTSTDSDSSNTVPDRDSNESSSKAS